MDPRILRHYNRELQFIREMGGEFAEEYPKIAGRLSLSGFECADPYVERLLEGFAFLAARVQLKLESSFPQFTQHLLELVYPHYLAPTPSMAVVQMNPEPTEGALAEGFPVARGTILRSLLGKDDTTACEYRTAHDVTLWPIELTKAEYLSSVGAVTAIDVPVGKKVRAAIRLRLRTTLGVNFSKLPISALPIYLLGGGDLPTRLYEQILGNNAGIIVRPTSRPIRWQERLEPRTVRRLGFETNQALLPATSQSFQGYRLLHEYFSFPERFLFVELTELDRALRRCEEQEVEIIILLNRSDPALDNSFDAGSFALHCTPAINLFPKRADRIHLDNRSWEQHVVPDRTRPFDFEVHSVGEIKGYGDSNDSEVDFLPFYATSDVNRYAEQRAYFTVSRQPRLLSSRQRKRGPRSSYVGNEIYVSLVDQAEAPYRGNLKQLGVMTLCTNRDLPLTMPVGKGNTDFTLEAGAPVVSVRCVAGPTKPRPSNAGGETAWRLVNHLSLNYLSLVDRDPQEGAAALRELLRLYSHNEAALHKQIDGIKSIRSTPVVRRVSDEDRMAFGRGLQIGVTCDEGAFEGTGVFLLGAVLDDFFARYVSINSFTETVVSTVDRGEVMRWPVRIGRRHLL